MGNIFWGIVQSILTVWDAVWWFVLPIIAIMAFWEAWLLHLHVKFVTNIKWKTLEIKVPKTILKTPKAMEQIFAAAHAPYRYGITPYRKYWEGQEEYWMVFELIGRAGETHFYLRVPTQFRNMMESAIYAAYPEAEITEAEDYLEEMPHVLPNDQFDVSGFEEVLRHENYLPIRTYPMFEESVEERRIDTIAPLMEAMSKLKNDEQLWFQVLIKPTGEDFRKEGEEEINKLMGVEKKEKVSMWPKFDLGLTFGEVVRGPFQHPGEAKPAHEEKKERQQRFLMTPVDKERAEAIHLKISKIAFEATLRFMYVERREGAVDSGHTNSIHGFIRQFNTQNLNSLRPYSPTSTASYTVKGLFKKTRIRARKRYLYEHYRHFGPLHHESILNIEELATVFHFPLAVVSTTELEKVESRKGSPPASLPIIEES
jgi:hypothetical protein